MTVRAHLAERYRRQGYLSAIPVLKEEEVAHCRSAVEELSTRLGGVTKISKVQLHFGWAYELVTHPAILDAVETVLGPDLLVHAATVFIKPADGTSHVSWHQDGYYLRLDPPDYSTAWVALGESTPENGCLRVIPGSHHEERPHRDSFRSPGESNLLSTDLRLIEEVDEDRAVDLPLRPGEMSMHHVHLIHGSGPNRSSGPRIGVAIRYVTPEVTQRRPHHAVVLARGRAGSGHFRLLEQRPPDDLDRGLRIREAFYRERDPRDLRRPAG